MYLINSFTANYTKKAEVAKYEFYAANLFLVSTLALELDILSVKSSFLGLKHFMLCSQFILYINFTFDLF